MKNTKVLHAVSQPFAALVLSTTLQASQLSTETPQRSSPPPATANFTRVVDGPIATNKGSNFTCAWGDFDSDGNVDLYVGNAWGKRSSLYRNNGDGTFNRITQGTLVTIASDSGGAVWGDYDNDGKLDIFTASFFSPADDRLYKGNGDGTFTQITSGPMVNDSTQGQGSTWVDYDRDGYLDLFVANGGFDNAANFLFHNLGNGRFEKIRSGMIVTEVHNSFGAAWSDIDGDRDPDLLVANSHRGGSAESDSPFRNDGGGRFTLIKDPPLAKEEGFTRGVVFGDVNNDGNVDVIAGNSAPLGVRLCLGNGDGTFRLAAESGLANPAQFGGSPALGDWDNDGWLDLFMGDFGGEVNVFYHNNGDGTFTRVTDGEVANEGGGAIGTFGCAFADYDSDGALDLFAANAFSNENLEGQPQLSFLYHNNGNTNGWLHVKLMGTVSNRSAIGTRVHVKATIGGKTFWQMRDVSGGEGFLGQPDQRLHFGFGDAKNVEEMIIEWPSGATQRFLQIEIRRVMKITEPAAVKAKAPGVTQIQGLPEVTYDVEASEDLSSWRKIGSTPGGSDYTDPAVVDVRARYYRAVSRD